MDFMTVLKTRRSVRAYADKAVTEEVLGRVLEAGRVAPSACNYQPWRFIVVRDAGMRSQLAKEAHGQMFVAKAPVVIVCCGKPYPQKYNWMGEDLYLVDMGVAIEHMVLAARNEGLGTCWIGAFEDQPIKALLEIPAEYDVVMLLALGYPASEDMFAPTTERLGMEQVVYGERFGRRRGK